LKKLLPKKQLLMKTPQSMMYLPRKMLLLKKHPLKTPLLMSLSWTLHHPTSQHRRKMLPEKSKTLQTKMKGWERRPLVLQLWQALRSRLYPGPAEAIDADIADVIHRTLICMDTKQNWKGFGMRQGCSIMLLPERYQRPRTENMPVMNRPSTRTENVKDGRGERHDVRPKRREKPRRLLQKMLREKNEDDDATRKESGKGSAPRQSMSRDVNREKIARARNEMMTLRQMP
jgi:hypothetical protein